MKTVYDDTHFQVQVSEKGDPCADKMGNGCLRVISKSNGIALTIDITPAGVDVSPEGGNYLLLINDQGVKDEDNPVAVRVFNKR